jgi:RNA polymerase sigma-70 factor (ECF subfamily)
VALTAVDRELLKRCLNKEPGAWNDFVDRFLGLIYHVIHHTAHLRSMPLRPEDVEDLAAEVLVQVIANDYAVLRQFRGHASLATYLTVISRRICVQELVRRAAAREVQPRTDGQRPPEPEAEEPPKAAVGLETLEEVGKLLKKLPAKERQVVRLYYLEGRTYEEIATELHIPINSIGPVLSRARKKLREGVKGAPPVVKAQAPVRSEAKAEARPEARAAKPEAKTEPGPEARPEAAPEPKPEAKPEAAPEPKPEPVAEGREEAKTEAPKEST